MSDKAWKITDFGLTAEGTSRRAYTTQLARGTNAYRAPELLREGSAVVTYESDIWSLGCIFYELATTKKVFVSDFAVLDYCYYSRGNLTIPFLPVSQRLIGCLSQIIRSMLEVQWWKRPSSRCVRRALRSLCRDRIEAHSLVVLGEWYSDIHIHFRYFSASKRQIEETFNLPGGLHRILLPNLPSSCSLQRVEWKPYWYHIVL